MPQEAEGWITNGRALAFLSQQGRPGPDRGPHLREISCQQLLVTRRQTGDVKAGQYPSPLGYETIDPSTNPFYSHSYIFNFGLPFRHTGTLTKTHVTPVVMSGAASIPG